jgi:adenylate kinase family enzyme
MTTKMTARMILFSGGTGSGKTTISRKLADLIGWRWASFGDFVRREARRRKLSTDIRSLQELGESMVEAGARAFCAKFLEEAEWSRGEGIVIDGLRHLSVLNELKAIAAPVEVVLLVLDVSRTQRRQRLLSRGYSGDPLAIEEHRIESDVTSILPGQASLRVDGSLTEDESVMAILRWLSEKDSVG